jgi:hypothetical protein
MSEPIQSTFDPSAKQKLLDELARALFGSADARGQMAQGPANGEGLWFDDNHQTPGVQSGQYRKLPQPVLGFDVVQEMLPYTQRAWDVPDGMGGLLPSWYQNPELVRAALKR